MRILLAVALALAACTQSAAPLEAPQPGYPCGVAGVVCYDTISGQVRPTGMCCWQGSVCGGGFPNVGCPAGQCCEEGLAATRDAGHPRTGPQLPAAR